MKKIFFLLASGLLMSGQASAYGIHISTGTGITCFATIAAHTESTSQCSAHVASETPIPNSSGKDINGQRYTAVLQKIDNLECFNSTFSYAFDPVVSDIANGVNAILKNPVIQYHNSYVQYNNAQGVQDVEMRNGVKTYIDKQVEENAEKREEALFADLFNQVFATVTINYDDQTKTMSEKVQHIDGRAQGYSNTVDFAKGVRTQSVTFTQPYTVSNQYPRYFTYTITCSPISERK